MTTTTTATTTSSKLPHSHPAWIPLLTYESSPLPRCEPIPLKKRIHMHYWRLLMTKNSMRNIFYHKMECFTRPSMDSLWGKGESRRLEWSRDFFSFPILSPGVSAMGVPDCEHFISSRRKMGKECSRDPTRKLPHDNKWKHDSCSIRATGSLENKLGHLQWLGDRLCCGLVGRIFVGWHFKCVDRH